MSACDRLEVDPLVTVAAEIAKAEPVSNPVLPQDCRTVVSSGIRRGEALERATERLSIRLRGQNERILRCADWYDTIFLDEGAKR